MGFLEKLGLRKAPATGGAEGAQEDEADVVAQKGQAGGVSKGQIWRDLNRGADYEVIHVIEGSSLALQCIRSPESGFPPVGFQINPSDASELVDDPAWTLVGGPSSASSLFDACKRGDVNIARGLIEGDPGLVNAEEVGGISPLHVAATEGRSEVVTLLLDNGADADARNDYGVTPLYLAAAWGHGEVVSLLLAAGADKSITEQSGETPLGAATRKGHIAVAKLLE